MRLAKAQRLARVAIETALKSAGLPPLAWYDVLLEVERAGETGLRPLELERALLLEQYNLSRLLDRIEPAGCVARRRREGDGRGRRVVITAAGMSLRCRMWPVYAREIESAVGRPLSAEQTEALNALLGRLIETAEA